MSKSLHSLSTLLHSLRWVCFHYQVPVVLITGFEMSPTSLSHQLGERARRCSGITVVSVVYFVGVFCAVGDPSQRNFLSSVLWDLPAPWDNFIYIKQNMLSVISKLAHEHLFFFITNRIKKCYMTMNMTSLTFKKIQQQDTCCNTNQDNNYKCKDEKSWNNRIENMRVIIRDRADKPINRFTYYYPCFLCLFPSLDLLKCVEIYHEYKTL